MILGDRARLRIGHVNYVIAINENSAGAAELLPLVHEFSVLIEDLDAIVAAVGHKQSSLGIKCERVRPVELSGSRSLLAPGHDELPVSREFHDARVAVSAMPIGDENVCVRRNGNG